MRYKWFLVYSFNIYIFLVNCGQENHRFTLPREGIRLKDSKITKEVICQDLSACMVACNPLKWCLTVSFCRIESKCLLSSTRVTHDVDASRHLVAQPNWVTYSKAYFKVFLRRHPSGKYKSTYADAVSSCSEMNTVVASETDLLETRALGLIGCTCGWLSNRRNGFVLQDPSPCWPTYSENVVYCDYGKADVWCRL